MANLSKTWTGSNSWVSAKLVVESVANATGNYSDVTATLYGARNDGGTSGNNSANFYITIDGSKSSRTSACTVSGTAWTQVNKYTKRVYHNDDGTKTISISAGGGIIDTTFQMGNKTYSFALDNISVKSSMTVIGSMLGVTMRINIDRKNDDYTDTITYKCGSLTGTICEKTSEDAVEWIPPVELASQNTQGGTVDVVLELETFSGSTSIGKSQNTISCSIPPSASPTTSISFSDFMELYDRYGAYVQGKSVLAVEIESEPSYGASIVSYNTMVGDQNYSGSSFLVNPITISGEFNLKTTVTDSRGKKDTAVSNTVKVLPYEPPILKNVSIKRSGENDNYLYVSFDGCISPLNNKNSAVYKVWYKMAGESAYTEKILNDYDGWYDIENGNYTIEANKSTTYDVVVIASDDFGTFKKHLVGKSGKKTFSLFTNGEGLAFGKLAEFKDVLDVGYKTMFSGGLANPLLPTGTWLNEAFTPNTYVLKPGMDYRNEPGSGGVNAILDIVGEEGGFLLQRYTHITSDGTTTYERIWNGSTWTEWADANGDVSSLTEDSGWIAPTLYSDFTPYQTSTTPKYRKVGKTVYIKGQIRPSTTLSGGESSYVMFDIPTAYRPPDAIKAVMAGANGAIWDLDISVIGKASFSRLRDPNGNVTPTGGQTLHIYISYMVD